MPIGQKIAMVLTDLEMPEMDGFTLTRRIKGDDLLNTVPVVIHSSLSGSANESHAKRVGANGFVAKFVPGSFVKSPQPWVLPRNRPAWPGNSAPASRKPSPGNGKIGRESGAAGVESGRPRAAM